MWDLDAEEVNLENNVALKVAFYSVVGGYDTFNYYGIWTTADNFYWAAEGGGSDTSLAFYIGHGYQELSWNWCPWLGGWFLEQQFSIYDNWGNQVYDRDIFPCSAGQNVKLAFLYACRQGDTLGGTHWSGTPFGMPFAWLHDETVSTDGYACPSSGSQVFIGFNGSAPQLVSYGDLRYSDFMVAFYYAALAYGNQDYSVKQALDYAAKFENSSCATFADTDLYRGIWDSYCDPGSGRLVWEWIGNMRVYGNSNIHLSKTTPTFAMKTTAGGNFYVPSGPPTAVQIYQLFNNSGIVGDQTGATPPYTSLSNYYPNGQVDIYDAIFVSGKVGKSEGQSGWEYMADVTGNRIIDIFDCIQVANNYGKSGTYITDLTNVTVTFSVPGGPIQESVEWTNGLATIPPSATSFTVKRNGSPIGAVAIFWSRD
jgi:hypothetical protein